MLTSLRKSRAFTLLELIVVIIILGILALLAVPTYNAVIQSSKEQTLTRTAESFDRSVRALHALNIGASPNGQITLTEVTTQIGEINGPVVYPATAVDDATLLADPDIQFVQDGTTFVCLTLDVGTGTTAGTIATGLCS